MQELWQAQGFQPCAGEWKWSFKGERHVPYSSLPTNHTIGICVLEYVDASVTDVAIQSLNGMELSDKYLVMQHTSVGAKPGMPNLPYDQFPEIPCLIVPAGESNTSDACILPMLNMVTPKDLVETRSTATFMKMSKKNALDTVL